MPPVDSALFHRAHAGDAAARDELFAANTGLIWASVRKYGGLLEKEDLFQLGAIGLLKAIDRFDPSYGTAFSTFAVPHILGEIQRNLRDSGLIKIQRRMRELSYLADRTRREIVARAGEEPPLSKIAEILGVSLDALCEANEAVAAVLYLEDLPGYSAESHAVESETSAGADSLDLRLAVEKLDGDLRAVIEGRFFGGKTQSEIAEELGISQAQVSRLEKRALFSLRAGLGRCPEGDRGR